MRTQGGNYESISYIDGMFEYKTDGNDEQTLTHIMDDTSRIAMIRTGDDFGDTTPTIKYNLEDHLGSSSILLGNDGVLINKEEYYPFGETSFGSYTKKRYRYSGKEKDLESGLYYYGARYYAAWTCRFISVDLKSSEYNWQSAYVVSANNPVNYIDVNGESPGDPVRLYIVNQDTEKDNQVFWDAAFKIQQEHGKKIYGWNGIQKRRAVKAGFHIKNYINSQADDSIQSIDFFTHGGHSGMYFKHGEDGGILSWEKFQVDSKYKNFYRSESDYENEAGIKKDTPQLTLSASLEDINIAKFKDDARIEIHGCATAGESKTQNAEYNFASEFSRLLFEGGKENAVVIGHIGQAGPFYEEGSNYGDYRQNYRVVFWNGEAVYETTEKGHIDQSVINLAIETYKKDGTVTKNIQ